MKKKTHDRCLVCVKKFSKKNFSASYIQDENTLSSYKSMGTTFMSPQSVIGDAGQPKYGNKKI